MAFEIRGLQLALGLLIRPERLVLTPAADCRHRDSIKWHPNCDSVLEMTQRANSTALRRLRRAELPTDTVELARYLIGRVVVHDTDDGRLSGRIVETEAYPIGDSAGRAFRGQTPGNASLFLERGHAHVYFTYGSSFMLNVTSEAAGVGAGVLLRALEPLDGVDLMQRLRGDTGVIDLARGPGRLARAMQIDRREDGLDLCAAGPLWLAASGRKTGAIGSSVRIGLTRNVDRKLRFYEEGNPHVSGPKRLRE
jgi:DNA-3-methyladenine glycosylase